jgi:hypothetical protein
MVMRLVSLVGALALAFAPVALEVCQASCLSQPIEAQGSGSAHHHSHEATGTSAVPAAHGHHHAAANGTAQPRVTLTAGSYSCDHSGGLPSFSAALDTVHIAPAILTMRIDALHIEARSVSVPEKVGRTASNRIPLTTELRV